MATLVRLWGCLLVALTAGLAVPAPAAAHFKSGRLSTDFEARVGSFRPPAPGVRARVLDGDLRLELRVPPWRSIVVLGLLGEPFLRFSATGVEANLASPTASSARVIEAADTVSSAGGDVAPRESWTRARLARGTVRPVPIVRDPSTQARAVANWSIPLVVDGRRTTLVGSEWYASGPSPWPWFVAGALLVALGGVGARLLSRRMQRLVASVLLPVAVVALAAA